MSDMIPQEKTYNGRGSLMLLRVMGLDSIVQRYGKDLVISDLRLVESFIRAEINHHKGLVSGNLKNGIYAFFGWSSNQTTEPLKHAVNAFDCARQIQLKSAEALQKDQRIEHPMFPLQIALCTDIFCVCRPDSDGERSLGQEHSGIIGRGAELAQRIVEYCGIKSIVTSPETERVLQHLKADIGPKSEIHIKMPNSSKRITAYEHNVLQENRDFYNVVTNRIKRSINRRMDEQRWRCVDGNISVDISGNVYRLMNISRGGLEIEGSIPHTHGELVSINFNNHDNSLKICAEKLQLDHIRCEIRWNRKSSQAYNLGLMFLDLNEVEREELISLIVSNSNGKAVI